MLFPFCSCGFRTYVLQSYVANIMLRLPKPCTSASLFRLHTGFRIFDPGHRQIFKRLLRESFLVQKPARGFVVFYLSTQPYGRLVDPSSADLTTKRLSIKEVFLFQNKNKFNMRNNILCYAQNNI